MKFAGQIISMMAIIGACTWYIFQPGFEPIITCLFGLGGFLASIRHGKLKQISKGDFIGNIRSVKIRYAEKKDYKLIEIIANHHLGERHGISASKIAQWSQQNSKIFRVAECFPNPTNGKKEWYVCGYYSLVPIVKSTFSLLKSGTIEDFEINAESISGFGDENVNSLYIMDLMTQNSCCPNTSCSHIIGSHLIRDLVWNVQKILDNSPNIDELSSIIASDNGRILVNKFGFNKDKSYRNSLGWEFWSTDREGLKLHKQKKHMPILFAPNRFAPEYTI